MKRRAIGGQIGAILVLTLLLTLAGNAAGQAGNPPLASFQQTSSADWALGSSQKVDWRNLDALHTPYGLGSDSRASVRLASQPGTWTRQSGAEPSLPRGPTAAWDGNNVAEATVLHDGSRFKMWYSGQDAASNIWQMGLATSTNGLDWTRSAGNPVLAVGAEGEWDDQEVSFSCVLYDGTTYHTWYSGFDGARRCIGYASSPDGIAWTKHAGPVLSGSPGAWDEDLAGNPTVLHDGTAYHMWYGGWDNANGHWRIGHATSPNGQEWAKDPANPVLDLGPADAWDDTHVTAPSVLYDGTTFHMWYAGWDDQDYGASSHGSTGHATSMDGSAWTKDAANPVFVAQGGVWDPMWVVDPEIIFDGDLYHLWYTGGVTWTGLQIGYATAPPVYEGSGSYISPLLDSGCPSETIPLWDGLRVQQTRNDQTIVYALLDQAGQPIPGFDNLTADAWEHIFDLSGLSAAYRQVYLRATLGTVDSTRSPVLEEWQIIWICYDLPYSFYLPVVRN